MPASERRRTRQPGLAWAWLVAFGLTGVGVAVLAGRSVADAGWFAAPASARVLPAFGLVDARGRTRTLESLRGRPVVIVFGYTRCPEACPTALLRLAAAMRLLGPPQARPYGVFVTLDPERDSAELLGSYAGAFDPGLIALTGTPAQIRSAAEQFAVAYVRVGSGAAYAIDHTTGFHLVDAGGVLRETLEASSTPPQIAAAVRRLQTSTGGAG